MTAVRVDVIALLNDEIASAQALAISDAYQADRLPKLIAARDETVELVSCFDAMLSRWWSNVTQADKRLGNESAHARLLFSGRGEPAYEIDETLGERRREASEREAVRIARENRQ